ncbi:MAG: hypothetical protein ACOC0N_00845 [Chroococcales cyanobacterium]
MEALEHLPSEQAKAVGITSRALQGEGFSLVEAFGDETRQRNYYSITFRQITNQVGDRIGVFYFPFLC